MYQLEPDLETLLPVWIRYNREAHPPIIGNRGANSNSLLTMNGSALYPKYVT
jgi:hypothetical protein